MRPTFTVLLALALISTGCMSATLSELDRVASSERQGPPVAQFTPVRSAPSNTTIAPPRPASTDEAAPPSPEADELRAGSAADGNVLARLALLHNQDVVTARARTRSLALRGLAIGGLPDPVFKYELLGQPFDHAWSPGEAQMHMFGVRQAFAAPGVVDAQRKAALAEVEASIAAENALQLDVLAQLREELALLWADEEERRVHVEHIKITQELAEFASAQLSMGRASPSDVLRLRVERVRLHTDIGTLEEAIGSRRARINQLVGRRLDAPLGTAVEPHTTALQLHADALEATLLQKRPDLAAAKATIARDEALLDGSRRRADLPTFMVGFDYQVMPMAPSPNGFGVMLEVSLPWFSTWRRQEVRAAEANIAVDRSALQSLRSKAQLQLREVLGRVRAAQRQLLALEKDLLPEALRAFDVARATFAAGGGESLSLLDAQRTYLQVRIDRSRAVARLAVSIAALERTVGTVLLPSGEAS